MQWWCQTDDIYITITINGEEYMCVTAMIMIAATGAIVQAKAADSAAKAQANSSRYAAEVADNNAKIAQDQAKWDADGKDRDLRRILASNNAKTGGSGITGQGSPLEVQMDNVQEMEMDKLAVLYGGDVRSSNYEAEAAQNRQDAKNAKTAGKFAVGTSLLSGAGKIAGTVATHDAGYFSSAGRARINKPPG